MGERQDEPVLSIWQAKQREWEAAEAGWHEGKSGGRHPAHEVSGAAGPKVSAEADMRIFDVPWITQEVWEDDTAAPGSVEPDGHVIPEQRSHGGQRVQGVLQGHAGRRLHRAAGWLAFTLVLLAVGYLAGALGSGLSMTPDNGVSGQAAGGAKKTGSHALNSDSGNQIIIDVHGDVKRPGVYTLPSGSRVGDAVRAAGGYRHAADQAVVNAAELLDDGEEVVIPDAHSHQGSSGIAGSSTQAANSPGAPASGAEPAAGEQPAGVSNKTSAAAGGGSADVAKVDLNTADVATLETLPGVGPARAADIVQYRQEHGPFASVDDLDSVPGIGPATLARLKPYLYVSANPDRG
ncbi:ComEA family DNA-binding protein [Alicyclobacillus kakegawensis]|uniref:ComEA family DNA-binding protein n=1 Tax=Alicyclobacillus kakegawensis TaxID=392012 RepID=UPI00082CB1A0|nr:ComEA family DNA-binding protein [Alicyclobacillus kakegawensis]